MKKVELLLNELNNLNKQNLIKLIITEIIILILAIGIFYTRIDIAIQWVIFVVLILIFILYIILYILKQKVIIYCKEHYLNNPSLVIEKLNKRKTQFLDILDYTNEKLIFKEIVRALSNYYKYPNKGMIGPWEIIYNQDKTKAFYRKLELKSKTVITNILKDIDKLDKKVLELLESLGIDYHKLYDVWEDRFTKKNDYFELMYPLYGMIVNDSQVFSKGLKFGSYNITDNIMIKPYERQLENEDVIMLHIKIRSK